jgi:hypothetical protein
MDTLLGKQSTFTSVFSSSFRGIFLKLQVSQYPPTLYIWCMFGSELSVMKSTLLGVQVPSRLYFGFHWTEFLALPTHAVQAMYVWLRSVNNEEHITYRKRYLFSWISVSIGGFFLKIHTSTSLRMFYKQLKFGLIRSIMKGTLFGE